MTELIRQLKDARYRLFYRALLRRAPLVTLGNDKTGCAWTFCPDGLGAQSIYYGGGVGYDITFEHALVDRFGCNVVLFDPSPTGLETMHKPENHIPQFKFHPVALAGQCGSLKLSPPQNPEEGSWFAQSGGETTVEVPCVDLATLMRQNGDDRIDLLKIDIEGAEYEVLDDLLERRLRIRQVLVEFHHSNLPGIRRSRTVRAILKMVAAGYRLLKQEGNNHTFLHSRI
jgi:FkbM family methyltransferase